MISLCKRIYMNLKSNLSKSCVRENRKKDRQAKKVREREKPCQKEKEKDKDREKQGEIENYRHSPDSITTTNQYR